MRVKKRDMVRIVCLLLCFGLIFPVGLTPLASAENDSPVQTSLRESAQVQPADKISNRLQKEFETEDTSTFLLKFKEQVDTKKVAADTEAKAQKQQKSAAQVQFMKRSAVVNALRVNALETQHNVVSFLEQQLKEGQVKDYHTYYIVNGISVTGTKEVAEKLAEFAEVEKILPNELRQLVPAEAADTKVAIKQAEAAKSDRPDADTNEVAWGVETVGAPAVWNMGIDGSGTVVANIDTGVEWNHPAVKEKYRGYDPADPDNPDHEMNWFDPVNNEEIPYDFDGHGTHTMGTMVGAEPDGSNLVGVAPGAQWIAVQAFTPIGGYDTDLLAAAEWVLAPVDADGNPNPHMAPDVVNNSWGGGPGLDEWYMDVVDAWRASDIFPAFSAGNSGPGAGTVGTPSNYPQSFSVGATDINDELASFSSRGPGPYEGDLKPDVSAPGVSVRSSVPGGGYANYNGTSMAAPHVSGAVALLRSANASLSVDDLEEILITTAVPRTDDTYPEAPNYGFGHGIINAFDAVSAVTDGLGQIEGQVVQDGEDTEAPTFEHAPVSETYDGMDLPLVVHAQDNVSVTSVNLQYRADESSDWQTVEASRIGGDFRSGTYQAVIPGEEITGSSLYYRWHIVDFGENEVTSDTYEVSVLSGITVGYEQDFESYPVGWVSFGDNAPWEWGIPTSGPGEAYSGEQVYATNLDGHYGNNTNATLMLPPVDLPEGESYLQFKHWYNIENNFDNGYVVISTDLENWEQLSRFTNVSNGWVDSEVPLSGYAGQRVYLGFNLVTDFSVTRDGWYLNDVALSDTSLDAERIKAQLPVERNAEKIVELNGANGAETKDKKPVDLSKITPGKVENVQSPTAIESKTVEVSPLALPLAAQVSVLETGRSVNTNPADGSFRLTHAAGEYTMRAEAYGFHSADQPVEVPVDGVAQANFVLDPIAQGTVAGTVTNRATGEPIEGATLLLIEDAVVEPVETDADGEYSLTAYEGTYTLSISAPHFYSEQIEITITGDETLEHNVELQPFIGYPGEIAYDDGTAENARAFYDAGNAWAVRMSLDEGHERAMVTAGVFRFWDTEWPIPGGEEFQVAIFDASGPDGAPGRQLAGPIDATALRTGEWTIVDLASEGVIVEGDFYMVYIQTHPNPNAPGLATDENGPNAGRSWQRVGGVWSPSPTAEGNYMIRAHVSYEVTSPVITSPEDGLFTNDSVVTVEGEAAPTTEVTILNNGEAIGSTATEDSGTFAIDIELTEGENVLTATASTDTGTTEPSEPVTVVLDQTNPELSIDSPADRSKTNRETVIVEGIATDENLDTVKVNGNQARVADDGSYSLRVMLDNGENVIDVVARDKAGNETSKRVTIFAKYDAPVIENLQPTEDKHLKAGESVKIEFDSEPGLRATFVIHMPLTNARAGLANATELPMMEMEDGYYVGYWTATANAIADGAVIEVIARDDFGNETREKAEGKLYINLPNE